MVLSTSAHLRKLKLRLAMAACLTALPKA
jgi:hypothetical protein